jgi:hypothetical protein
MANVLLVRHAYMPDVTLGTLSVGNLKLATLEEPWRPNPFGPGGQRRDGINRESCVPDGHYELRPHSSPKHPNVWALVNPELGVWHGAVPPGLPYGRSAILLHTGNTTLDIEGCILVGLKHGRIEGAAAVLSSRTAMAQLQAALGPSGHMLIIRPTAGTSEVYHV